MNTKPLLTLTPNHHFKFFQNAYRNKEYFYYEGALSYCNVLRNDEEETSVWIYKTMPWAEAFKLILETKNKAA